jgi:cytochrome c553
MRAALLALMTFLLAGCGAPDQAEQAQAVRFQQAPGETQVQHGDRVAHVLGCASCHGPDLRGQPWDEEADYAISFSSNLTRALPAYSDAQLERAVREGVRPDGSPLWGMPSEIFTHLDPADLAAVTAYLRTLPPGGDVHPRIIFGPRGRRAVASGEYPSTPALVRTRREQYPPALGGGHALARYIVRATCGECHGIDLKGRTESPSEVVPDLIVAGAYSRDEFHRLMRTGVPTGGRRLRLMDQVARSRFSHFTDGEIDAIYDYLVARANAPQ